MSDELRGTTDPKIWVDHFMKNIEENGSVVDKDLLLQWFSEAIITGYLAAVGGYFPHNLVETLKQIR